MNNIIFKDKTIKKLIKILSFIAILFVAQILNWSPVFEVEAQSGSFLVGESRADQSDYYKKSLRYFANKNEILPFGKIDVSKEKKETSFEKEISEMVSGYPIEEMMPYIAEYDKKVGGLIVGIAKKESDWGKHSPSKNGKICYNYWGYKGAGSRGTALGYGCFSNPEEAVQTIGNRIKELVDQGLDTPSKMIVWKCGRSCAGHNPAGVKKWISDVQVYFNKIAIK